MPGTRNLANYSVVVQSGIREENLQPPLYQTYIENFPLEQAEPTTEHDS